MTVNPLYEAGNCCAAATSPKVAINNPVGQRASTLEMAMTSSKEPPHQRGQVEARQDAKSQRDPGRQVTIHTTSENAETKHMEVAKAGSAWGHPPGWNCWSRRSTGRRS